MAAPSKVLVIGASRGIGLGMVEQTLLAYPKATVYATARSISNSPQLKKLADENEGRVSLFEVDATSASSMKALAASIAKTTTSFDQVIYNAGVLFGWGAIDQVGAEPLKKNLDVNLFGALYAATEFAPFVEKSTFANKAFVMTSSNFGSMSTARENFDGHEKGLGMPGVNPTAMYDISKTALNRLGLELDYVLRPRGAPVLLIHPGLVKTDLNPMGSITVAESTTGIINTIGKYSASNEQQFLDWEGKPVAL